MQRLIIVSCSAIALIGFIIRLCFEPSFEPAIGVVVSIGAIASSIRQNKEATKESTLDLIWEDTSPLLTEMKSDMENPEFKGRRFFWLLDSDWVFNLNKPYLSYYYGKLPNLEHQVAVLKSRGYISDESEAGKNVKKYKFNEAFVQQLRGRKI